MLAVDNDILQLWVFSAFTNLNIYSVAWEASHKMCFNHVRIHKELSKHKSLSMEYIFY